MNLPVNYFWIPNYENRYAMRFDAVKGEIEHAVYSFVTPGWGGAPAPLTIKWTRTGNTVSLTSVTKTGKETHDVAWLANIVRRTDAYQKATRSNKVATKLGHPITDLHKPKKVWMIGIMKDDGNISFSETPKQHTTREEAFKESEFLASVSPSQKFIIVETIRVVQASKLTITDL